MSTPKNVSTPAIRLEFDFVQWLLYELRGLDSQQWNGQKQCYESGFDEAEKRHFEEMWIVIKWLMDIPTNDDAEKQKIEQYALLFLAALSYHRNNDLAQLAERCAKHFHFLNGNNVSGAGILLGAQKANEGMRLVSELHSVPDDKPDPV